FDFEKMLEHFEFDFAPSRNEQVVKCACHEDSRPSMSINLNKAVWHCHGCGESGGALQFIAKKKGVSVVAARTIASDLGLKAGDTGRSRSEEHTSELQSRENLVCRLLLDKKKMKKSLFTYVTVIILHS